MSIRAYVLANVEVGSGAGVVEALLAMEAVKSAENVTRGPLTSSPLSRSMTQQPWANCLFRS